MQLLKAIFSRRWIAATLVVLLGMALMVRLSIWQFDRLAERRAANAVLAATLASESITLTGEPFTGDVAQLKDRQVVAEGEFDRENQVMLLVQSWQGRAGVHLITPFLIAETDTAVLVDRGWVPQTDVDDGNLALYDETGPVRLTGVVALSQPLSRYGNPDLEAKGPQTAVYRIDVPRLQEQMPYELLPFYVIQAPPPEGNTAPPLRELPQVDLSEGPHLSYALQWLLFTLILGGGYLIFVQRGLRD
ncbi:MAG: SURF1 family protein [Chloroflexi bacterium]|nr:SURF1 family protein [Ardenticatenaceae bacterium]MBL1131010.1 SURF1 family protein [Chloroflexota bacterium]NOG37108.1 SURF1 family protein [Chloroflexota bacterium]GIK58760.1 MAG: SURF1-like protein [Chloroflexota bacterium]